MRLGRRAATVPRDGAQGEACRAPGVTTGARCSGMASWPTARSCLPLCCLKTPGRPTAMKHSPSVNIIMPTEPVVRYCHTALPIAAALSTFPSLALDVHRLGLTRCALAWTAQAARMKTAGTFLCYRSSACRTASSAACQWAPSAWPPFSRSRASVRLCWTPAVGAPSPHHWTRESVARATQQAAKRMVGMVAAKRTLPSNVRSARRLAGAPAWSNMRRPWEGVTQPASPAHRYRACASV